MDSSEEPVGRRRKRVSRACNRCRSKKDRCDGTRPTCVACQNSGAICSYDPSAKKRGLPEGYVRGLEKLWALSIFNIDGLEDGVLGLLRASDGRGPAMRRKLISLWLDESVSDKLHELWKSTVLYQELETLLTAGDTENVLSSTEGELQDQPTSQVDHPLSGNQFEYRLNPQYPPTSQRSQNFFPLQLPEQTPKLLELYFLHTHCWFPIPAKDRVIKAFYSYPYSSAKRSDYAALWAILSYTTAQLSALDAQQLNFADPLLAAKNFYNIGRRLIPNEQGCFEVGHIQALLLLALVNFGLEDLNAAWLLSNQAACLALHLDTQCLHREHDPDKAQANATVLGCFLINTVVAVRLGRCPQMRAEDLISANLSEEDELERMKPGMDIPDPSGSSHHQQTFAGAHIPSPLTTFSRLIELAILLNRISRYQIYGNDTDAFCHTLTNDIQTLETKFPPACHFALFGNAHGEHALAQLPDHVHLAITYIATLSYFYIRFSTNAQILLDPIKALLRRAPGILAQTRCFGTSAFSPLFEWFVRIIVDGASVIGIETELGEAQASLWLNAIVYQISERGGPWPILASLVKDLGRRQAETLPSDSVLLRQPIAVADVVKDTNMPLHSYFPSAHGNAEPPAYHSFSGFVLENHSGEETFVNSALWPPFQQPTTLDRFEAFANSAICAESVCNTFPPSDDSRFSSPDGADVSTTSEQMPTRPLPVTAASILVPGEYESNPHQYSKLNHDFANVCGSDWTTDGEQELEGFRSPDKIAYQSFWSC